MNRSKWVTALAIYVVGISTAPADVLTAQAVSPAQGSGVAVDYADHFRVYRSDGTPGSLEDITLAMVDAEAVMIGEVHTDPVGHWLEAEIFRAALALRTAPNASGSPRSEGLSLEMFETDVQGIVDEYLGDLITEAQFRAAARPWPHYGADYRPLVEIAKEAGVPVIAANAPRRYVNRVSRLGPSALADLPAEALRTLPPLPFPAPTDAYRAEWNALMSNMSMEDMCPAPVDEMPAGHVPVPTADAAATTATAATAATTETPPTHSAPTGPASHGGSFMENGLQAQTLWDASMARAMTSFLDSNPGGLVVHMVGGFHVMNHTGTPEKVQFYRPGTRSLVISMDTAADIAAFNAADHAGRGDFVILTDRALDLNYERNCS